MFGRERAGFGLPWPVLRENVEARDWLDRLENERQAVYGRVVKRIDAQLQRESSHRTERRFVPGDRVWLKRIRGLTGPGLQPVWIGPYRVYKQVGEYSFEIGVGADRQAAHASKLKLCVEVGDEEDLGDLGAVVRRL